MSFTRTLVAVGMYFVDRTGVVDVVDTVAVELVAVVVVSVVEVVVVD